jgi:hypothetical protein
MVDEPELNLHPENQRRVARLFSRLVNIGIKVFITTHSDYIIKELNTLIMLNHNKPRLKEIAASEGYKTDELLSADKVKVYIASVVIVGIPPDAMIIKVDVFQSPDAIFSGSKGECKRADYVIIADSGGKKRILYIEMKKTKGSLKEVIQQLTGARCFLRYCQEIGKSFWYDNIFLNDYQHRFVSIDHTSIPKRKTREVRRSAKHDTPEKVMKIDWPHRLQFNRLVGA